MRIRHPIRVAWNTLARRSPIDAQLVVTRRCNLSCGYCHEYDRTSLPVPTDVAKERIDVLHRLGTASISLLGGEPLLHPDVVELIRYISRRRVAGIITNGFLLTDEMIRALNDARLDYLQLSIDAAVPSPDLFIIKSLKSLSRQLELLRAAARFSVNVNIVLCPQNADEFTELVTTVESMGFPVTIGLVHGSHGRIMIHGEPYVSLWESHFRRATGMPAIERTYGARLLRGETPDWRCRAGRRYLYVDEAGRVQYCASQRGRLDVALSEYSRRDMRRYGDRRKGCEPGCTIGCAYRTSAIDNSPVRVALTCWRLLLPRPRSRSTPGGSANTQKFFWSHGLPRTTERQ